MTHVGDRLSALVDGELDHETRDQILAHVAQCGECRDALDAERRVHSLIGSLGAAERAPAPSDDMITSLMGLAGDAPYRPLAGYGAGDRNGFGALPDRRPGRFGGSTRSVGGSTRPARSMRATSVWAWPSALAGGGESYLQPRGAGRRRLALGVAGAASAMGVTAALAFTMNWAPDQTPQVNISPPSQQFRDAKIVPDYPTRDTGVVADLFDSTGTPPGVIWRGTDR